MSIEEGQLLWQPSEAFIRNANITHYMAWLRQRGLAQCSSYDELWQWSVGHVEEFWASLWDYFEIRASRRFDQVVDSLTMQPGSRWFVGARANFAEHILCHERANKTALYHLSEIRPLSEMSWNELAAAVRILATRMRAMDVQPGDSVCCLMPNIPETVIAMLASISIGAVWSNAAPEFGKKTILDRFGQIRPKWLFVADGYSFGGRHFNRRELITEIVPELGDSLRQVVYLPYLDSGDENPPVPALLWSELLAGEDPGRDNFHFEQVGHEHPLWVLFSSGTTGLPKAIVHSQIGALLEIKKLTAFHSNLKPDDTAFFYTTTGWMMFNLQVAMMMAGSTAVLYDGNPVYPTPQRLWEMAAQTRATLFGASPSFVKLMAESNVRPGDEFDLQSLNTILCSGSPCTPETFAWFYNNVKADLWVTSQSGGTEVLGCFVGASPTLPVYAGEIQARALGMDVASWDEAGSPLLDQVGELVCKTPFPSMPLYFLNDDDNQRYRSAYFDDYPGVWRHGDFIKFNERGGSYIYGRSDATLNRHGVRIGTAELYRVVESLPEVVDSLVVCLETPDGGFFMPMFLQLGDGVELGPDVTDRLSSTLRLQCSPRHVPDQYYAVPAIPYTLTGKKMEIPVRKLLTGSAMEEVASPDSIRNPEALQYFIEFARTKGFSK